MPISTWGMFGTFCANRTDYNFRKSIFPKVTNFQNASKASTQFNHSQQRVSLSKLQLIAEEIGLLHQFQI